MNKREFSALVFLSSCSTFGHFAQELGMKQGLCTMKITLTNFYKAQLTCNIHFKCNVYPQ